ncbi:MAG: phosphatase [Clostridiales bacterium GWB2_37_7]|nr:MAG: phosphatase [Clostridiales bacterium GWB2_37_7]
MKLLVDTHCHTLSSGHAYSTIKEMADYASQIGMKIIGMTDHGPSLPGAPHIYHFGNLRILPEYISGVRILKGVEANIMSYDGTLDMPEKFLSKLELVIAGFHDACLIPGSVEENTRAVIGAMKNPLVDIIAHPGNPQFPVDVERVVACAIETSTLIEINNSSFGNARRGSEGNCRQIALEAKEKGAMLTTGSDSHICFHVGKFDKVLKLFEDVGITEELVISSNPQKLIDFLNKKGKKINYGIEVPFV